MLSLQRGHARPSSMLLNAAVIDELSKRSANFNAHLVLSSTLSHLRALLVSRNAISRRSSRELRSGRDSLKALKPSIPQRRWYKMLGAGACHGTLQRMEVQFRRMPQRCHLARPTRELAAGQRMKFISGPNVPSPALGTYFYCYSYLAFPCDGAHNGVTCWNVAVAR